MRKIKVTIIEEREVEPAEEARLLLEATKNHNPVPEGYRFRGDCLRVITASSSYEENQILVVRTSGQPDGDGDYKIWYFDANGKVQEGYANRSRVVLFHPHDLPPPAPVRTPTRSKRLHLEDHTE